MTDIGQLVRDLNEAWQEHRYDDLRRFFHESVVLQPPGAREPLVGVDASSADESRVVWGTQIPVEGDPV